MQFVDLAAQQKRIRQKIESNIAAVLDHGRYIMGPEVGQLEQRLADYVGVAHGIGCASGTDALLMALLAFGTGPGDAVLTTPFTFIATAEVIRLVGATPVFVDIDPQTFNIDPAALERAIKAVENNDATIHPLPITHHPPLPIIPKCIITVDLFGLPADYAQIERVAREHGLFLIEDAAQSLGAEVNGRRACSFGDIGCTSFFPAKPLGCYGDGGMCFTDDDRLAEVMQSLRIHGKGSDKYDNVRIGINGRLDTLQAAILQAKFDIFPEELKLRQKVAQTYSRLLATHPSSLITPYIPKGYTSAWAQYSVLAEDAKHRARLQNRLQAAQIPSAVYYPKPLHLQTAFAALGYRPGDFAVSEKTCERIFSLPMHPYLTDEQQQKIADVMTSSDR